MAQEQTQNTSVALVKASPAALVTELEKPEQRQLISAMLVGTPLPYPRFVQIALREINANPDIRECDVVSVLSSMVEAAREGLEIGGTRQECFLVPIWDRTKGHKVCNLWKGARGKKEQALRSGKVEKIQAAVVRANDKFRPRGGSELPEHDLGPNWHDRSARGPIIGAYAWATFTSGAVQVELIDQERLQQAEAKSSRKNIWRDNPEPMAKKTAVHDLTKLLPMSAVVPGSVAAQEVINAAEMSAPALAEGGVVDSGPPPEPAARPAKVEIQRADGSTVDADGVVTPAPWRMTPERLDAIGKARVAAGATLEGLRARIVQAGLPTDPMALSERQYGQVMDLILELGEQIRAQRDQAY